MDRARDRLAAGTGRELLRRRAWIVLLGAAAVGAARPLLWPLPEEAPAWGGAPRALILAATALALGLVALRVLGRRRPSGVAAARAVDGAIGLREVVASGYAFEQAGVEGPMVGLARARAEAAAREVDIRKALPLPSPLPRKGLLGALAPVLLLSAVVGAYDPALVTALTSPPTDEELTAASSLESAARELDREQDQRRARQAPRRPRQDGGPRPGASSRDRRRRELAERARAAARAARRGDRAGALRDLDALGREGRQRSREAEALRSALRRMAEALDRSGRRAGAGGRRGGEGEEADGAEGREGGREGSPREGREGEERRASSASEALDPVEALRELARQVRSGEGASREATEEVQRMLSTLAAAAAEAARSASGGAEERSARAASAMERAASAMSRGDREAAARALEEAARTTAAMSEARTAAAREAEAIARLLEATGALERAMQLALAGRSGEPCPGGGTCSEGPMTAGESGRGEGLGGEGAGAQALARALARRLAAMAPTSSEVGPGAGGHIPDRGDARRGRLEARGTVRERAHVREGARAVKAIRGLGRSEEPGTEYSEVFPSYAAMAEESVQDEAVPAARRETVRRYFEAIRPGGQNSSVGDDARGE